MRNSSWFAFLCLSLTFVSCDKNRVFDAYKSLPDQWHKDSIVNFKVQAPDSINAYNLYVNLRNTSAYKFNNLYLIVSMEYPHGKVTKDTLEYKMAEANGEFIGTGFSDVKENKLWYKGFDSPFVFNEAGEYTIGIQQAMRENGKVNGVVNLEGITEVGFRIEKPATN